MNLFRSLCFTLFFVLVSCVQTDGDIIISDAWVRATAPGQKVAAAYMNLSSKQGATLVSVECALAGSVEIHTMTMENDVMKMRMLDDLPLPAGKSVSLAPGGLHLMLFNLKQPLDAGKQANFTLKFRTANGEEKQVRIVLPIKTSVH